MTNIFSFPTNARWEVGPYLMPTRLEKSDVQKRVEQLIKTITNESQRDFAIMVGLGETLLSKLLSPGSTRHFNDDHLEKIERATNARLEWMKRGELPQFWTNSESIPDRSGKHEGKALKEWMDRAGIQQAELARRLEKGKSTVNQYFKSASLSAENKKVILQALGAKYDDVFGQAQDLSSAEIANEFRRIRPVSVEAMNRVMVMRIPVNARAGFGYQAFFGDNPKELEYVPISEDRLYPGIRPEDHGIIVVNGDSMEPLLQPGFEVLLYRMPPGTFPKPGKIVVVDFQDELIIKRLRSVDYVGETVVLRSDNGGDELKLSMGDIRQVYHVYDYYKSRL
ncbi:LexA family transcriptional regulator [Fibrella forsythiae]|uniref:Helix-turn-helix transcriptional regulator n=1 Tax=Fibrella forsythiae TaxID=2817061 RepID=A0ABS3JDN6_9BACT|nr:XRE family transcriptional regulator [Fibrella forsythiae]MBO0947563.1 helix-turn-helix transcriptional regulator [Fibrella forsythiae]